MALGIYSRADNNKAQFSQSCFIKFPVTVLGSVGLESIQRGVKCRAEKPVGHV